MSEEQLIAFQEAVIADAALKEKLRAAGDVDAVVVIANDAGFVISAEELGAAAQAAVSAQAGRLSDEELECVTGGLMGTQTNGLTDCLIGLTGWQNCKPPINN